MSPGSRLCGVMAAGLLLNGLGTMSLHAQPATAAAQNESGGQAAAHRGRPAAHGAESPARSRSLAGTWQGTLSGGPEPQRIVIQIQIAPADGGGWKGTMHAIDQNADGIPLTTVSLDGRHLKLGIADVGGTYEGFVSADGSVILGTWMQGERRLLALHRATKATAWPLDVSPHAIRWVNVDRDVRLEVLDWGGQGPPLVLLSGLGDTAHVFDRFAPKLTASHHVYGITRRGFGASSTPPTGYTADQLGDDVLAALAALEVTRPVLVGHSIAGEELSSIGSRHPQAVAGLVYLEAAYGYAFFDPEVRAGPVYVQVQVDELRRTLNAFQADEMGGERAALAQQLLSVDIPRLTELLHGVLEDEQALPPAMRAPQGRVPAAPPARAAIMAGLQKYSTLKAPVLAIFAVPHSMGAMAAADPSAVAAFEARDRQSVEAQAAALARAVPQARIVRLPRASHYVFLSNEADVLREINTFVSTLPVSAVAP